MELVPPRVEVYSLEDMLMLTFVEKINMKMKKSIPLPSSKFYEFKAKLHQF